MHFLFCVPKMVAFSRCAFITGIGGGGGGGDGGGGVGEGGGGGGGGAARKGMKSYLGKSRGTTKVKVKVCAGQNWRALRKSQ